MCSYKHVPVYAHVFSYMCIDVHACVLMRIDAYRWSYVLIMHIQAQVCSTMYIYASSISIDFHAYIYMYMYIYICRCVCVWVFTHVCSCMRT